MDGEFEVSQQSSQPEPVGARQGECKCKYTGPSTHQSGQVTVEGNGQHLLSLSSRRLEAENPPKQ
jgi:hypothetical protein